MTSMMNSNMTANDSLNCDVLYFFRNLKNLKRRTTRSLSWGTTVDSDAEDDDLESSKNDEEKNDVTQDENEMSDDDKESTDSDFYDTDLDNLTPDE